MGFALEERAGGPRAPRLEEALGGGEDYELVLATADPDRLVERLRRRRTARPRRHRRVHGRAGEPTLHGTVVTGAGTPRVGAPALDLRVTAPSCPAGRAGAGARPVTALRPRRGYPGPAA